MRCFALSQRILKRARDHSGIDNFGVLEHLVRETFARWPKPGLLQLKEMTIETDLFGIYYPLTQNFC